MSLGVGELPCERGKVLEIFSRQWIFRNVAGRVGRQRPIRCGEQGYVVVPEILFFSSSSLGRAFSIHKRVTAYRLPIVMWKSEDVPAQPNPTLILAVNHAFMNE